MESYTRVRQKPRDESTGSVERLRGQRSQQIKVRWMGRRRTDGGQWKSTWKQEIAKQLEVQMAAVMTEVEDRRAKRIVKGTRQVRSISISISFPISTRVFFRRPIKLDRNDPISPSSTPRAPPIDRIKFIPCRCLGYPITHDYRLATPSKLTPRVHTCRSVTLPIPGPSPHLSTTITFISGGHGAGDRNHDAKPVYPPVFHPSPPSPVLTPNWDPGSHYHRSFVIPILTFGSETRPRGGG